MKIENMLLVGAGALLGVAGVAYFMKTMVDRGYPEIAKFPIKAADELYQRSQSPELSKAAVTVMSKATEALVDERDNQNKQWQLQRKWWY